MGTFAASLNGGVYRSMWFSAFRGRLTVSIQRLVARSGSSLGSALEQNNSGFLVRADLPHQTTSAPTAAAPLPESMSR